MLLKLFFLGEIGLKMRGNTVEEVLEDLEEQRNKKIGGLDGLPLVIGLVPQGL